jgi:hypothetical protein
MPKKATGTKRVRRFQEMEILQAAALRRCAHGPPTYFATAPYTSVSRRPGAELIIPVHAHLQAIHASLREISCYTKAADQKRLAEAAMGKAKARTSSG